MSISNTQSYAFLDLIPAGVYIYNIAEQKNDFISRGYTELTGWTIDDIEKMGEAFLDLFHPDDREAVLEHMKTVMSSKDNATHKIAYRFKKKSGEWMWCESSDTPFERNPTGTIEKFIGAFLDITEQKRLEQELRGSIKELEKLNTMMVNREIKMNELKKEIEQCRSNK